MSIGSTAGGALIIMEESGALSGHVGHGWFEDDVFYYLAIFGPLMLIILSIMALAMLDLLSATNNRFDRGYEIASKAMSILVVLSVIYYLVTGVLFALDFHPIAHMYHWYSNLFTAESS